jgi:hypothetical protein
MRFAQDPYSIRLTSMQTRGHSAWAVFQRPSRLTTVLSILS